MKSLFARMIALVFTVFGITANTSSAATVIATTGVSPTYVDPNGAYLGNTPSSMTVSTNPGGIYLTFRIADSAGQYFTLNSVSIDISVNGILASTETYDSYILASNWNRIGVYATNSYGIGLMNQGPILVGFGDRNSTAAYSVNLNPGDVWQAKVSYDVQGLGVVTSIGTVSRIPEPSIFCCLGVSIFGLLRRRR